MDKNSKKILPKFWRYKTDIDKKLTYVVVVSPPRICCSCDILNYCRLVVQDSCDIFIVAHFYSSETFYLKLMRV